MGYCGPTNTPELDNTPENCKKYEDTNCVIYQDPIPYFGFATSSTSTQVFDAIIAGLEDVSARIHTVEQDLGNEGVIIQTKTSQLENDGEDGVTPFLSKIDFQNFIEGTYEEIKAIRDAGDLVPGFRYIITDYQTQYFIKGSNSSGVIEYKEITSYISGWAVLDNSYEYNLFNGMTVEITELPAGYGGGLQVGDTTTVSSNSVQYYWKFANGMQSIIGLKFKFAYDRYSTIPQDSLILDNNGKVVMQPQGLINTDVHDGTAYMDQTASENFEPVVERIVLQAAGTNSFRAEGFSETFFGDTIEYDMDDTDIINDNQELIGTRKGLIIRRATFDGNVDIKVDWRAVRYRRWLIDLDSRTKFLNEDLLTDTKTRHTASGYFLYKSNVRSVNSTNAFYIARDAEGTFYNLNSNGIRKGYTFTRESDISCKDFSPITLDSNLDPHDVPYFVCTGNFDNTVFMGLPGEFDYDLAFGTTGQLLNNTFVSNFNASSGAEGINMYNCTFLDATNYNLSSDLHFEGCQFLAFVLFTKSVASQLINVIIGGMGENERINGMGSTNSWFNIQSLMGSYIYNSALGSKNAYININKTRLMNSNVFFGDANPGGGSTQITQPEIVGFNSSVVSNVVLQYLAPTGRITMNDWLFPYTNTITGHSDNLFVYKTESTFSRNNVLLNRYNFNLYRHDVASDDTISIVNLMMPE